jgi:hypothetical protein
MLLRSARSASDERSRRASRQEAGGERGAKRAEARKDKGEEREEEVSDDKGKRRKGRDVRRRSKPLESLRSRGLPFHQRSDRYLGIRP